MRVTYNDSEMVKAFFSGARAFLTGFSTTLGYMFKPSVTVNYPQQKVPMFPK